MSETADLPTWTFTDHLTKAREHAGLDLADMAGVLGCSERTVRNYENGATRITRGNLIAWAMSCGVPLEWFPAADVRDLGQPRRRHTSESDASVTACYPWSRFEVGDVA